MATHAVFVVGKGRNAQFIFAQHSDGYPEYTQGSNGGGVPNKLLRARSEREFLRLLLEHTNSVDQENREYYEGKEVWDAIAHRFSYVFAFFDGRVWITMGQRWFNPLHRAAPPTSLPPTPVLRKGKLEGSLTISCGECNRQHSVTAKQLLNWSKRHKKTGSDLIAHYFENKGFVMKSRQGTLCWRCQ